MTGFFSELALLAIMLGLIAQAGVFSWTVLILALLLVGFSFVLEKTSPERPEKLRADHALVLAGLMVLIGSLGARPVNQLTGLWLVIPSLVLLVLGLVRLVSKDRTRGPWSPQRIQWALAGLVTLVACGFVAGGARAVLALRSTVPISPGKLSFLLAMLLWAAIWFGLDVHLRTIRKDGKKGLGIWLWNHRHSLSMLLVVGISLLRKGFS